MNTLQANKVQWQQPKNKILVDCSHGKATKPSNCITRPKFCASRSARSAKKRLAFKVDDISLNPAKPKAAADTVLENKVPRSRASARPAEQGRSNPTSEAEDDEDDLDLTALSKPASIEDAVRQIQPDALEHDSVIPARALVLALIDLPTLNNEW